MVKTMLLCLSKKCIFTVLYILMLQCNFLFSCPHIYPSHFHICLNKKHCHICWLHRIKYKISQYSQVKEPVLLHFQRHVSFLRLTVCASCCRSYWKLIGWHIFTLIRPSLTRLCFAVYLRSSASFHV